MQHQDPRKARASKEDRDLLIAEFPHLASYIRKVYELITSDGLYPSRPVLAAFVALMDAWQNPAHRAGGNLGKWAGIRLPFVLIKSGAGCRYHTVQTDLLHSTLLPFSRSPQFAAVTQYLAEEFDIVQLQECCCAVNWLPGDRGRTPRDPGVPARAPKIHSDAAAWIESRSSFGSLAEATGAHVLFAKTTSDLPDTLLESQWEIRLLNSVWFLVCKMAEANPVDWENDRALMREYLSRINPMAPSPNNSVTKLTLS